jgi:predicted nucleotidyltransferase
MAVKTLHTKDEILKLLEKNREQIKEFGVSKLGLFGSYAKGEQNEDSDMDFLVLFKEGQKNYDNLFKTAEFLESLFDCEVDVLTDKSISNWLKPHIDEHIVYVEFNN